MLSEERIAMSQRERDVLKVMQRVKLQPLPPSTIDVLDQERNIIRSRIDELLLDNFQKIDG